MANSFRVENYYSAKNLSMIVVGLLAVQLLCYVFYLILSGVQIAAPNLTLDTEDGPLPIPLLLIGLLSFVEIMARLATVVVFLIWLYRAYSNLSALKAQHLEFTPGWAVGWWFIPFANLVKPYQAVSEAWRESDPDYNEDLGYLTSSVGNPWQFPVWWGSFLIGNLLSRISDKVIDLESGYGTYAYLLILTSLFSGVAATILVWIVRDTTRRQDQRFDRIGRSLHNLTPPPPPTFGQTV